MDQLITLAEVAAVTIAILVPLVAATWVAGRGLERLLEGIPDLVAIMVVADADRFDRVAAVEAEFVPLNLSPLSRDLEAPDPRDLRALRPLSGRQQFQ